MPRLYRLITEAVGYTVGGVALVVVALVVGENHTVATSILISLGTGLILFAVPKLVSVLWILRDRPPVEPPRVPFAFQVGASVRVVVFGAVGALTAGTAADIYKFAPQTFVPFNGGIYLLMILGSLIIFADAVLKDLQAGKRTAGVAGGLAALLLFYAMFPNMPDAYKPAMIGGIIPVLKYGLFFMLLSQWHDRAERTRKQNSHDGGQPASQ